MKLKYWKIPDYISFAEDAILGAITIVLLILAVVLLFDSVAAIWKDVANESIANTGIEILNSVLLVMMIMEIVYTVKMSLKSHTLVAEPFLIIGAIAAVRRMLVITAESTQLETTNPSAFQSVLMELGLLGFLVLTIAISVYILRRSSVYKDKE